MTSDAFTVAVDLLRKYDRPGPRYTSYPTAVEFHAGFDATAYRARLSEAAASADHPLSLYLHLPFCEERCTFCGCMVVITKKRDVAAQIPRLLEARAGHARRRARRGVVVSCNTTGVAARRPT